MLFVYWLETGVVGVFNVVRMIRATQMQKDPKNDPIIVPITSASRIALTIFFCIHYGFFWLGHGFFIREIAHTFHQSLQPNNWVWFILVPLVWQYVFEYVKERKSDTGEPVINNLFLKPYGRVIVQHLVVIVSSMPLLLISRFPQLAAVGLVIIKMGIENALPRITASGLWKRMSSGQATVSDQEHVQKMVGRVTIGMFIVMGTIMAAVIIWALLNQ